MLRKKLTLRHHSAVLRVAVAFDERAHAADFNTAMAVLIRHERAMMASPSEDGCALYGAAVENLYRLAFGEEAAQAVLAFYGDDVTAMVNAVHPFIRNTVAPAVRKVSLRGRKAAARDFLRARKKALRT